MKNIVLIPNINKDVGLSVTKKLAEKLNTYGAVVCIEKTISTEIPHTVVYDTIPLNTELIIVIGGDGSVIDASVTAIEYGIPILGVNLGRVGYLSEIEPDNLDVLAGLFNASYRVEEKMLLSVLHVRNGETTRSARLAVNDVIISHNSFLGIADFRLENGAGDCVKYRADGLILSTPAGSTAYSLSAGGPIVSHDIDSIVATPICPHSFFNRSIIFRADEKIRLKNAGITDLNISIDGRYFANLLCGDECVVEMAEKKLKVITFNDNNMFATLFKKMRILQDIV